MLEKHTVIDEEAIFESLLDQLDERYTLNYVSYDESIQPQTLHDILKDGLQDQLYEVFLEQECYYAKRALDELLDSQKDLTEDQKDLFRTTDEYQELLTEIRSRNDSEAEKELFCQSRIRGRVTLHSNYDCWLPLWEAKGLYGTEDALQGIMKMLCLNPAKVKQEALRKGIACYRRFPNLRYREGREVVPYEGFVNCLLECPNYGLWTFFGLFDMKGLWNARNLNTDAVETDPLIIPKGTTCTMFNSWNGGGSLDFTETIRDVSIKELNRRGASLYDCATVYVDEKFKDAHGYSSGEVYGGTLSSKPILTEA